MACRSLLNRILQAAEDERLIPANPVAEPRVYTPRQVGQLLAYAAPEDRGVLLVLIGTGLRAGELCGLRGTRLDLGTPPRRWRRASSRHSTRGWPRRLRWSRPQADGTADGTRGTSPVLGAAGINRLPWSWLTRPPVIRGFALCLPLTEREPLSLRGSRVAVHDRTRVRERQRERDLACGRRWGQVGQGC
jgi:integrase